MHILCIWYIALYWPTLQFYVHVYVLFVCQYMAPPGWVLLQHSIMWLLFFTVKCGMCTFSVLCVCSKNNSKFRHYPHPLGYLCAKFRFFRSLCCWASPWRKIAYSITQSLTLFMWCTGTKACASVNTELLKQHMWIIKITHVMWSPSSFIGVS